MYLYIETLKQRLDAINQLRVDRALAAMGPAFQKVYSLLPILLHCHHPQMPGYLDGNVPHGVCLFTPNEIQQDYLADIEARWGEPLAPSAGANCRLPASIPWGAPPPLGSATHRI